MKKRELIDFLRYYNRWRRGDDSARMPQPSDVGLAIDAAVAVLRDADTDVADFVLRDFEFN